MRVTERQTLLDIALRERGDWTAAWELAQENNMALSDEPDEGTEIEVTERSLGGSASRVVREYAAEGVEPASGVDDDFSGCGGIGMMQVGTDFEIS